MDQNVLFSRNIGLLSAIEQDKLRHTKILIAGVGGDGGLLAERLVRAGIGKLILADPELFEQANVNRQYAANAATLGVNKAVAVANEIRLINPAIEVVAYTEGITKENVASLVAQADIIVDEIEYTQPYISVMLHSAARSIGKYVFMGANIGWGATAFCFEPGGKTFEEHFNYNAILHSIDVMAYVRSAPSYISEDLASAILTGDMAMPSVAPSVSLAAAILSSEIIFFITGKREPIIVPRFIAIDLFDLTITIN